MKIISVELLNEKALSLLKQLEQLNILRLVSEKEKTANSTPKRKWAGSISKESAKNLLQQLDQSRNEFFI